MKETAHRRSAFNAALRPWVQAQFRELRRADDD